MSERRLGESGLLSKLAYNGSIYTDNISSYTVQTRSPSGHIGHRRSESSTWPSNNANGFSGTLGADLPWNSRYVGTLSYTMMRQNSSFIPMSHPEIRLFRFRHRA